jgi:hypothetical protein
MTHYEVECILGACWLVWKIDPKLDHEINQIFKNKKISFFGYFKIFKILKNSMTLIKGDPQKYYLEEWLVCKGTFASCNHLVGTRCVVGPT